jgi:hypothetical protein
MRRKLEGGRDEEDRVGAWRINVMEDQETGRRTHKRGRSLEEALAVGLSESIEQKKEGSGRGWGGEGHNSLSSPR